jgi:hypothetical protein
MGSNVVLWAAAAVAVAAALLSMARLSGSPPSAAS